MVYLCNRTKSKLPGVTSGPLHDPCLPVLVMTYLAFPSPPTAAAFFRRISLTPSPSPASVGWELVSDSFMCPCCIVMVSLLTPPSRE